MAGKKSNKVKIRSASAAEKAFAGDLVRQYRGGKADGDELAAALEIFVKEGTFLDWPPLWLRNAVIAGIFHKFRQEGVPVEDAIGHLAESWGVSDQTVKNIIYPRKASKTRKT